MDPRRSGRPAANDQARSTRDGPRGKLGQNVGATTVTLSQVATRGDFSHYSLDHRACPDICRENT